MKAIVTGNSHGIGLAITEQLRKEGVNVPNISRTHGYNLMTDGLEKLVIDHPDTDILVNNIGGGGRWGNDILNFNEWDKVMYKNYGITKRLTLHYLPKMIQNKYGRVITIASIYGTEPGAYPWFSVAKASQIALMRSMANRWEGVTFNSISPSNVRILPNEKYNIKPEDIGQMFSYLYKSNLDGCNVIIR